MKRRIQPRALARRQSAAAHKDTRLRLAARRCMGANNALMRVEDAEAAAGILRPYSPDCGEFERPAGVTPNSPYGRALARGATRDRQYIRARRRAER